jgi:tRNA(fMet)-specific endonuclease VapC
MSFLLHRDTCAAFVRNVRLVTGRFLHHHGDLHISAVTVMELEVWLSGWKTPIRFQQVYWAMRQQVRVLDMNEVVAQRAAQVGAKLYGQGQRPSSVNLLIAATALHHGLTLVTHNQQRFAAIPGLTVIDWQVP